MSTATDDRTDTRTDDRTGVETGDRGSAVAGRLPGGVAPVRALALGAVGLLVLSPLSVLYYVSNVAGSPDLLLALAGGALLAGAVMGRLFRPRVALGISLALLVAGGYGYFQTLPQGLSVLATIDPLVQDTFALLTGLSVLRIVNAGAWALAVTPAPMFLVSYLAVRRHYAGTALVGGATLGLFVLTGDVSTPTALLGVVGAAGAVGFGDIDRRSGSAAGAEVVAVVLALMVVVTLTVSVVPAGAGGTQPGGGGEAGTVEASLIDAGDSLTVQGSIDLSPEVRFTVTSDEPRYWRVGSYDRYTGDGWVRTGGSKPYDGALRSPPGQSRSVRQTYRAETGLTIMPAAWKPRELLSGPDARVTDDGGLRPTGTITDGERYAVESRVPVARPADLRDAGTDYPQRVEERYTQLPASTPDRVRERTARITANADSPYETALVVEQWLENNRRYSLDVQRPDGNIADAFLFEMEAGYCTYYATTMVTMLRSQGVPARFVVGYTPGERVAADQWVARGLNSHAWVEVYFPETGWVRFDPTPAGPREATEQSTVDTARANNISDVDTNQTGPGEWTPTPATPTPAQPGNGTAGRVTPPGGFPEGNQTPTQVTPAVGGVSPGDDGGGLPELPSREQLALGLVVLVGAAAGARRAGVTGRAYRAVWLRYQPRRSPESDVERAFERLEYLLARQGHERAPGDTPRQFLAAVDDERVQRLGELYERARYAGRATPEDADEAVELVDELVAERSPLGRFR